jgi:hypothetical protein
MSQISHPTRRGAALLASLVVALTLLGPRLGASATERPSISTTTTIPSPPECTAAQLSFSRPSPVSAQLGEDGFTFRVTNVSGDTCQMRGFPVVRFYTSAGRLLTFTYSHKSQYFRYHAPRRVTLAPNTHAYFLVAKYRCDLGDRYVSSYMYLFAPHATDTPFEERTGVSGPGAVDYCKGSSRDPGQTIGVTAIVASKAQLFN